MRISHRDISLPAGATKDDVPFFLFLILAAFTAGYLAHAAVYSDIPLYQRYFQQLADSDAPETGDVPVRCDALLEPDRSWCYASSSIESGSLAECLRSQPGEVQDYCRSVLTEDRAGCLSLHDQTLQQICLREIGLG